MIASALPSPTIQGIAAPPAIPAVGTPEYDTWMKNQAQFAQDNANVNPVPAIPAPVVKPIGSMSVADGGTATLDSSGTINRNAAWNKNVQPIGGVGGSVNVIPSEQMNNIWGKIGTKDNQSVPPISAPIDYSAPPKKYMEQVQDSFGNSRLDDAGKPIMFTRAIGYDDDRYAPNGGYVAARDAVEKKLGFIPSDYDQNPIKYQSLVVANATDLKGQADMLNAQTGKTYHEGVLAIDKPYKEGMVQSHLLQSQGMGDLHRSEVDKNKAITALDLAKADPNSPISRHDKTPAEVYEAEWMMKNGVAKDAKDAFNQIRTARSDPTKLFGAVYASISKKNELATEGDANYKTPEELSAQAWGITNTLMSQKNSGTTTPFRDISPLRQVFSKSGTGITTPGGTDYPYLVTSALTNNWTPAEIQQAAKGTPGEKDIIDALSSANNVQPIGGPQGFTPAPGSSLTPAGIPAPVTATGQPTANRPPLNSFYKK